MTISSFIPDDTPRNADSLYFNNSERPNVDKLNALVDRIKAIEKELEILKGNRGTDFEL